MKLRLAGWETWFAAAAGSAAAIWMPTNFYAPAVSEIVTVLGFLIAAFVPAMALSATGLRAGGFSVMRIRSLGTAMRRQIQVFGGLFLYSLIASGVAIFGKIMNWNLPRLSIARVTQLGVDLNVVFPGLLTFLLAFLTLRSLAFVAGVESLLNLSVSIAEDEARARDRHADVEIKDELEAYEMPAGYGARLTE